LRQSSHHPALDQTRQPAFAVGQENEWEEDMKSLAALLACVALQIAPAAAEDWPS
jgi:hypothetical protein